MWRSGEGRAGGAPPGARSAVLCLPLRQHRVLLFLRQLAVLVAEEPEPGSLRRVLAARIAAAHVELAATQLAHAVADAAAARRGQRGGDVVSEYPGETSSEQIEGMGGWSGHRAQIRCGGDGRNRLRTDEINDSYSEPHRTGRFPPLLPDFNRARDS